MRGVTATGGFRGEKKEVEKKEKEKEKYGYEEA